MASWRIFLNCVVGMGLVARTRDLSVSSGKQGYPRVVEEEMIEVFREGVLAVEMITGTFLSAPDLVLEEEDRVTISPQRPRRMERRSSSLKIRHRFNRLTWCGRYLI